ncbi:MAG: hypothetical protein M3N52_06365 [Actinomycetota bacterium]|nr:hypothetical protein [Actinomycetota bacterium]
MGRFLDPLSTTELPSTREAEGAGPAYELDPAEARALHAQTHETGCWCQGLDPVAFLDQLFVRELEPRGFRRPGFHKGHGLVLAGPGIAQRRLDELHDAIRNPSPRQ